MKKNAWPFHSIGSSETQRDTWATCAEDYYWLCWMLSRRRRCRRRCCHCSALSLQLIVLFVECSGSCSHTQCIRILGSSLRLCLRFIFYIYPTANCTHAHTHTAQRSLCCWFGCRFDFFFLKKKTKYRIAHSNPILILFYYYYSFVCSRVLTGFFPFYLLYRSNTISEFAFCLQHFCCCRCVTVATVVQSIVRHTHTLVRTEQKMKLKNRRKKQKRNQQWIYLLSRAHIHNQQTEYERERAMWSWKRNNTKYACLTRISCITSTHDERMLNCSAISRSSRIWDICIT